MIFPPACPLCEKLLSDTERMICDSCKTKVSYVNEPMCLRCGKEIDDEETEYCMDCKDNLRTYNRGFPAINYESPVKESVARFKYGNRRYYADYFANEIYRTRGKDIKQIRVDALVPVPVHSSKLKTRGYNQATLLANSLSKYLDIPVDAKLLVRNNKTLPQKKLNDIEREINLKNAFNSTSDSVKYKSIMLVDDIYTTGATIQACTDILRSIGVKDVYYTSICIGKRD